jgi:hypothetical protein
MVADVITECVLSKDNNTWRFRFEPVTLGHVRYHGCRDFPRLLHLRAVSSQRDHERGLAALAHLGQRTLQRRG